MYYLNGPKVPHTMHVLQTARKRRAAMHGLGAARYDPRLFPSDPYYPAVYGNYVNKQVSIPDAWWYPHPFTHYFHFDTSGLDGLGSWWNPFSWLSSGKTYEIYTNVDPNTGEPLPGAKPSSIGREGQGWLAKIFGAIGTGFGIVGAIGSGLKSVGGGMYSVFNKVTGQTERKGYNELTPEQQLAAKKAEQWKASLLGQIGFEDTIFGIDTNVALILAAVGAFGIFFMMRQGGSGAQQPIVVIPGIQQQRTRKAKKNPRRIRHGRRN